MFRFLRNSLERKARRERARKKRQSPQSAPLILQMVHCRSIVSLKVRVLELPCILSLNTNSNGFCRIKGGFFDSFKALRTSTLRSSLSGLWFERRRAALSLECGIRRCRMRAGVLSFCQIAGRMSNRGSSSSVRLLSSCQIPPPHPGSNFDLTKQ